MYDIWDLDKGVAHKNSNVSSHVTIQAVHCKLLYILDFFKLIFYVPIIMFLVRMEAEMHFQNIYHIYLYSITYLYLYLPKL